MQAKEYIKKMTAEEARQVKQRPIGKKHFVRVAIEQLEVGEALQISREAFTWKKHTPKLFSNAISKKTKKRFEVSNLADKSGWMVIREE